jgi:hypothetical protein
MIRLEKSKALGRIIRQDDMEDLVIPTWALVRDAIRAGKIDEALTFLDYGCREAKTMHDSLCSFVDDALTHLATFGEEELYQVLRRRYEPVMRRWLLDTPGVMESLQRCVEFQRAHGGETTIVEESDRYVLRCNPCGSGGQLRRNKGVATTKKAYPWTWGKSGIPYYCAHCCVMWEILPTELRGYPIRLNLIGEKAEDPCVQLYYKKPELIPKEYFTRIGFSSQFEQNSSDRGNMGHGNK